MPTGKITSKEPGFIFKLNKEIKLEKESIKKLKYLKTHKKPKLITKLKESSNRLFAFALFKRLPIIKSVAELIIINIRNLLSQNP